MSVKDWMEDVNARFPVRKSKAQKQRFRDYVLEKATEMGYEAHVEELGGKLLPHRNVVIGNLETAKVLVTAHYDTPATIGLPNLMVPTNRLMFILIQLLIALPMLVCIFVPVALVQMLTDSVFWLELTLIVTWLLMMYLLLAGVPNPHNVNDNTSGTCAVLALLKRFEQKKPEDVAFVLFDNEEKGTLGASALAKKYPALKKDALVLNMDCVGVGEAMLFLAPKKARKDRRYDGMEKAVAEACGLPVVFRPLEKSNFSSDQTHFKKGIAICACRKGRRIGYYCSRIHTKRDTEYQEATLCAVVDGTEAAIQHAIRKEQV